MVQKIRVKPGKVRGGGNILSQKNTSDFDLNDSRISESTESVNGIDLMTYNLTLDVIGRIVVSVPNHSVTVGDTVNMTATVTDMEGNPVSHVHIHMNWDTDSHTVGGYTGSDGTVTIGRTTTAAHIGIRTIKVTADGYVAGKTRITVNKHTSSLILSMRGTGYVGDTMFIVGGALMLEGSVSNDADNLPVKIYQDGVLIDTVTTVNRGSFGTLVSLDTVGTTVFKVVYDGNAVNTSCESSEYTVTVSLNPTNLNISVPALVYSDEFDITGVLTDSNNNSINGASVKLYMETEGETTLQATGTTNSDGSVTFHRSAPTSITNYKFWLVYDGDRIYSNSTSSEVNRTVEKETTILSVNSLANNTSFDINDSILIAGTLLTNDNEKLPTGTIVNIKNENNILGTASVSNSTGEFITTINNLSEGRHTLTLEYVESTNYLPSTVSRHIIIVDPSRIVSSVALATNRHALPYGDNNEYATLTSTVWNNQNNGISGKTVAFISASAIATSQSNIIEDVLMDVDIGDAWQIILDNTHDAQAIIGQTYGASTIQLNVSTSQENIHLVVYDENFHIINDLYFDLVDNMFSFMNDTLYYPGGSISLSNFAGDTSNLSFGSYMSVYEYYGTASTDSNGVATCSYYPHTNGFSNIIAKADNINSSPVSIGSFAPDKLIIEYTGNHIQHNSNYNHNACLGIAYIGEQPVIDWGDGTTETYVDGELNHEYSITGNYIIQIQGNITGLNDYALDCLDGVSSIILPNTITEIANNSLSRNFDLEYAFLPNSLTTIGKNAFQVDTSLKHISIPNSVTTMDERIFAYCDLDYIIFNWTSSEDILTYATSYDNWFKSGNKNMRIIIPPNTISLYTAKGYPSEKLIERGD